MSNRRRRPHVFLVPPQNFYRLYIKICLGVVGILWLAVIVTVSVSVSVSGSIFTASRPTSINTSSVAEQEQEQKLNPISITNKINPGTSSTGKIHIPASAAARKSASASLSARSRSRTRTQRSILLSRDPDSDPEASHQRRPPVAVTVTSDVRGNLGPASVILQNPPGTNWIKDRWQAAGDMHGTAIPGQHWVQLDFGNLHSHSRGRGRGRSLEMEMEIDRVVIDWEAAYAKDYRIEISMGDSEAKAKAEAKSKSTRKELETEEEGFNWCVLFDGANTNTNTNTNDNANSDTGTGVHADDASAKDLGSKRSVKEYGQSPGVKKKTPLHVVHTIDMNGAQQSKCNFQSFRYLRVFINKSVTGWGVSIWELDVYGWTD